MKAWQTLTGNFHVDERARGGKDLSIIVIDTREHRVTVRIIVGLPDMVQSSVRLL
jgi:hypothetical protein